MQLLNAIIILAIHLLPVTLAVAEVTPFAEPNHAISWCATASSLSTCGPSTFHSSNNTPLADWIACAALYSAWEPAYSGEFTIDVAALDDNAFLHATNGDTGTVVHGYVAVLNIRDCSVGVKLVNDDHTCPYREKASTIAIGSQDFADILGTALANFSSGTELSVGGRIECAANPGTTAKLDWLIWNSAT